ncbi:DUF2971 domain-containing protein [Acinetobacter haemolyticus]|uniref:DUF2971 domain-containing protein n=1 Tax=Acinetobacter TaxID=469 RepID=UPI001331FC5C|nr:DUF2971 domain-containing protein [Acinetobacter haemolyticus]NAS01499.1 DUF2971 domain-containing protein [Acinetobacter haemolyticus]QHI30711.1 DUF2971 domain-containing protein [Acinetobacter haemolyticus]QHI31490.1 DUF2971 domain-containing protein [Acinetobacter haemolyticus]
MIFNRDSKKYLYHYTRADTAINYILQSNTLKVSSFQNTNDPKESKNWLFEIGTNHNLDLGTYNLWALSDELNREIKSKTYVICFSKDKVLTGNHLNDLLSRGYGHSRMWAQYAANHTGICLVFDNDLLGQAFHNEFSNFTYFAQNINYVDRFISERNSAYIINVDFLESLDSDMKEYALCHLETHKDRLFFEKLLDWEQEQEYRWVLMGGDVNREPLFNYLNSLKGIVFGANCSEENISKIVEMTKNKGTEYTQLKWRNCSPWYNFERRF